MGESVTSNSLRRSMPITSSSSGNTESTSFHNLSSAGSLHRLQTAAQEASVPRVAKDKKWESNSGMARGLTVMIVVQ